MADYHNLAGLNLNLKTTDPVLAGWDGNRGRGVLVLQCDDLTSFQQALVLGEAYKVFTERNKKYKDLWKEYGAEDSALHIRSKLMRLTTTTVETEEDDGLDLINYAVFWIRNWRDGRKH